MRRALAVAGALLAGACTPSAASFPEARAEVDEAVAAVLQPGDRRDDGVTRIEECGRLVELNREMVTYSVVVDVGDFDTAEERVEAVGGYWTREGEELSGGPGGPAS